MKRFIATLALLAVFLPLPLSGASALDPWPLFIPRVTLGCAGDAVAPGDFDADGLSDVAVIAAQQLCVFRQNPDTHALALTQSIPVDGSNRNGIVAGDFNDDGYADVATTHATLDVLRVWLQQPGGGLAHAQDLSTGDRPDALVAADVNHDGLTDVVVAHWNAASIGVFLQQPNGTLAAMSVYPSVAAGYDDIDAGDVNDDGLTDVVKMNGQGYANPNLMVYLQTAAGQLAAPVSYDLGDVNTQGVAVGDVTGDELADVVVTYGGNRPAARIAVLPQTLSGTLGTPIPYIAYDIPEAIEIADVNGDSLRDVVVLHGGWESAGVFLQQPGGTLANYQLYSLPYASHYLPQGLALRDVNADALPDMLVADYNFGLTVLYHSTGDLALQLTQEPQWIAPGDPVTATLVTTNAGPYPSAHIGLTDTLPETSAVLSLQISSGECSVIAQNRITCRIDHLAAGDSVTATVAYRAPLRIGIAVNRAGVAAAGDLNLANNTAETTYRVETEGALLLPYIANGSTSRLRPPP